MKVELNLSNYAIIAELKNAADVNTSDVNKSDIDNIDIDKLIKNVPSGLSSLKGKVDRLNIGKLKTTLVDLIKLIDVVKIKLLKRLNIMLRSKI